MSRRDDDLNEEIRQHLRMAAEDRGEGAARREFGNIALIKEATREMWGWARLERFVQDVRFALRGMRRNPAFTLTAVVSLALGIGANTATFSLIDALLLRSLPVRDPQQLVELMIYQNGKEGDSFPYPAVRALAGQKDIFDALAGFSAAAFNVGSGEAAERTPGAWVSGEYYQMLGLTPAMGRLLEPSDDERGAPLVAVISDDYWRRKFARDPSVIGRAIPIEGVPVTIAGVSPPGFTGANVGQDADLTLPLSANTQLFPQMTARLEAGPQWLRILARPRVSREQVKARLRVLWPQLASVAVHPRMPAAVRNAMLTSALDVIPGARGWTYLRRRFERPLLILMALVGMVLLIACANIANLLLARAQSRQREIAIRLAIGASRGRIIRQLLTESVLLATIGAAVAILFAWFGSRILVHLLSTYRDVIFLDLTPDLRVLAFTALLAVATGIVFGIAPAICATAAKPSSGTFLNSALVAVQVAVSFAVLVAAGLFGRTFQNLDRVDPGFRHEGVLLIDTGLHYAVGAGRVPYYQDMLRRIGSLPGVDAASLASNTPLSSGWATAPVSVDGQPFSNRTAHFYNIAPNYFTVMGIPLLAGRDFSEDAPSGIAIVNEQFVREFLPEGHPLGQRFSLPFRDFEGLEIVGVVRDSISQNLREPPPPTVYAPFFRYQTEGPVYLVHASGALVQVASEIRRVLQPFMPAMAIQIHTLTDQVEAAMVQERLLASLGAAFGTLALILAAVGLYGLLAYTVARRTNELGIRMALGAGRSRIIWLVIEHAFALLFAGMLISIPITLAASRWIGSMLFGVSRNDPLTIASAAVALFATGLVASYIPARRAARADPMTALRCE